MMWITQPKIILASGSASRQAMLKNAGLVFDISLPDVDETALKQALPSENLALSLAKAKACAIKSVDANTYIIGADQTLWCNARYYSKANNLSDAARQLAELSGKRHRLQSAVSVAKHGQVVWSAVQEANLTMRVLSAHDIDQYLSIVGQEILSSVGCYQIEAQGITLFDKIEGDHFTIMGLPLLPLLRFLRT